MMVARYEEYRTQQDEMVDMIAFRRFGTVFGQTERILEANPGLAALGEVLPENLLVKIPVPEVKGRRVSKRLWDAP